MILKQLMLLAARLIKISNNFNLEFKNDERVIKTSFKIKIIADFY